MFYSQEMLVIATYKNNQTLEHYLYLCHLSKYHQLEMLTTLHLF